MGLGMVEDVSEVDGAMAFLRAAFIEESGVTLRRRWAGADELFTEAGYAAFADDLLERMVNPWLADTIERSGRDPRRKLGWEDRLVGLRRLGLAEGVPTPRYAMGVAGGLEILRRDGEAGSDEDLLRSCWPDDAVPEEITAVLATVAVGRAWLEAWLADGFEAIAQSGIA